MKCAPIAIITLNRKEYLERCITSLQKNKYAEYTDLYIGLDFPPNEKYRQGYLQVKEYLEKGIDGFKSVNIIKHEFNVGAYRNSNILYDMIFENYDRVIFSEDDNEFSPNYLEFMNKCLEKYKNDLSVMAVSGYTYPIDNSKFDGNVFGCSAYLSCWGYAIWRDREYEIRKYINNNFFKKLYLNKKYMKKLRRVSHNQYANMVKGMLGYTSDLIMNNVIRENDLAMAIYMMAFDLEVIYPTISKVRNWGYDGSGVNCGEIHFDKNKSINHRNFNFDKQTIDTECEFEYIKETYNVGNDETDQLVDGFFRISNKEVFRTDVVYLLSHIIGLENTRKLVKITDKGRMK